MSTHPLPLVRIATLTDAGRDPDKQINEDSNGFESLPTGHCLVLCDGMGGHSAGLEASRLAVDTILEETRQRVSEGSPPGESLKQGVEIAGTQVYHLGGPATNLARPGCTCVAMFMHPLGTDIAHVGDSRAYVLRKAMIWPLTRDHSMVQQMVDAGLLAPEEAVNHPESNKITRALGMLPSVEVELRNDRILQEKDDIFVLVSDGVTDVVTDSDLLTIATLHRETKDMDAFCTQVVQLANARGGPDNITIQVVYVDEPNLAPEATASSGAKVTVPDMPVMHDAPAVDGVPKTQRLGDSDAPVPIAPTQEQTLAPVDPTVKEPAYNPPAGAPPGPGAAPGPGRAVIQSGKTVKMAVATLPANKSQPPAANAGPNPKRLAGIALVVVGLLVAVVSIFTLVRDPSPDSPEPASSASP